MVLERRKGEKKHAPEYICQTDSKSLMSLQIAVRPLWTGLEYVFSLPNAVEHTPGDARRAILSFLKRSEHTVPQRIRWSAKISQQHLQLYETVAFKCPTNVHRVNKKRKKIPQSKWWSACLLMKKEQIVSKTADRMMLVLYTVNREQHTEYENEIHHNHAYSKAHRWGKCLVLYTKQNEHSDQRCEHIRSRFLIIENLYFDTY